MTITEKPSKINNRDPNYMGVHQWVKRHYGSASKCENGHEAKTYQWANITGIYERDIANFKQLCRSCHAKLDMTNYSRKVSAEKLKGNTYRRKAVSQYKNGKKLRTYPTLGDAAAKVGVVRSAISNALTGRSRSAGGYEWRIVS